MRKLPIGIQSFEDLRENDYLYIDKSAYIWELVQNGKTYFLSRPRRFGKSLLISTMEAYFRGKHTLFQGLAMEKLEADKPESEQWVEYPVLTFSLSGGTYQSEDGLAQRLSFALERFEHQFGIERAPGRDLPTEFQQAIEGAYAVTGRQVVVLVDEYDKPLLEDVPEHTEQGERNRALFKGFFSILKDEDRYLRFVFITGVTKFNKVSIFSDLNQLKDISLLPKYAAICGITEDELQEKLDDRVLQLAGTQKMKKSDAYLKLMRMYDGYHFSKKGDGVYNPYSLFNALSDGEFGRYWFETGTPQFLYKALKQSGRPVSDFSDGIRATEMRISDYRADNQDLVPLYYQAGYLTIKGYDESFGTYTLAFPNEEVKYGFLESLIPMASPRYKVENARFDAGSMISYLRDKRLDAFMCMLQALLASIPYHEGRAPQDEQQWRNIIYAVFTVLGQYVHAEVHSAEGRADCVLENKQYVYIFEFKEDKSAEDALKQIDDMGYARPYRDGSRQVVKVGVNFSSGMKTLDAWKVEE